MTTVMCTVDIGATAATCAIRYGTVRYSTSASDDSVEAFVTYATFTDLAGELHIWKYTKMICFVI